MIGTWATSPLGLVGGLAALALGWWVALLLERRRRETARAARRAEVRRQPATLAGVVFREAGAPGREGCTECRGDGGWITLRDLEWGRQVEIEAAIGIDLPKGTTFPIFVRCPACRDADLEEFAARTLAEALAEPAAPAAGQLLAFPGAPDGGA